MADLAKLLTHFQTNLICFSIKICKWQTFEPLKQTLNSCAVVTYQNHYKSDRQINQK